MRIVGDAESGKVWVNDREVPVPPNARLPSGFGWGNSDDGLQLLAEAILSMFNPPEVAMDRASWFVAAHVSCWPGGGFEAEVPERHVLWS